VVLGDAHLRRILATYANYYNELRTHRSLTKDTRSIALSSASELSHHGLSSAAFTINIAESNIRYRQGRQKNHNFPDVVTMP
jgi:hypothetical protein